MNKKWAFLLNTRKNTHKIKRFKKILLDVMDKLLTEILGKYRS